MKHSIITFLLLALLTIACSDDFLNKKPNKSLVVPSTLEDLQALLDNSALVMNVSPSLGVIASDEFFTTDAGLQGYILATERNSYTWEPDVYAGETSCSDWNIPYQHVFYANVVLEGLSSIDTTQNAAQWKAIKGSALFYRAHAVYQLAQLFAAPYDSLTATTSMGIPLKLSADVNEPIVRASVEDTYRQVINDLQEALPLLPKQSSYKTRPTSLATVAMLSRLYLTMGNYRQAEHYADRSLQQSAALISYAALTASATRPIPAVNEEVIYYAAGVNYSFISSALSYVDTLLYNSYANNDLRKTVFFRARTTNRYTFKAHYTGTALLFAGIANDEVYLTRAECRVRNGNTNGALNDLNTLLTARWKKGTFVPVTETNKETLLNIILTERRKELVFRTTRFTDLRRLNKESAFTKTLSRKINGQLYTLSPSDVRYVYPIPQQEITSSGIAQNPR